MISELVNHEIFAQNLILGESLFLILKLPPHWQLAPGVSRPEIHATHERRGRKWVATGSAWYVIYDGERNWALELAISSRPARNKPRENGSISIAGHPAQLRWNEKRRGLPWQRHTVRYMTVDFECSQSERELKLEFSGWCPEEGFQEILQSVKQLQCH